MSSRRLAWSLAAFALVLLAPAAAAHAAWPGGNGLISFTSDRDGNGNLFAMPATPGADPTRLTDHPADDAQSSWSPDGRRIALRSRRDGGRYDIWTMRADGSDL